MNIPYQFALDLGDFLAMFSCHKDNLLMIPTTLQMESKKVEDRQVVEVTDRAPCREKEYLSEYLKQSEVKYQSVKRLQNGRILVYEYFDGAFLVLNEYLRVLQKIHCRLPIEEVRQQQDLTWKQVKCREEFDGFLNEGYTLCYVGIFYTSWARRAGKKRKYYEERVAW